MRKVLWGALVAATLAAPSSALAQDASLGYAAETGGQLIVLMPVIPYVLVIPFAPGAAVTPPPTGAGGAAAPGGLSAISPQFQGTAAPGVTALGGAAPGSIGQTPIGTLGAGMPMSTGALGGGSSSLSGLSR